MLLNLFNAQLRLFYFPLPLVLCMLMAMALPSLIFAQAAVPPVLSVQAVDSAAYQITIETKNTETKNVTDGKQNDESDRLLPKRLSPGEKILWGEKGLMRLTGLYPLTEDSRLNELSLRRGLLTAHEIGGFVTLGAMMTTVVFGQLRVNGDATMARPHKNWAKATIVSYFLTASMSLLSPPPMVRRSSWSSISIHKGLAFIHFSGMILTPLLAEGIAMEERRSGADPDRIDRDKAKVHLVSGYLTTVAFASALMVITF